MADASAIAAQFSKLAGCSKEATAVGSAITIVNMPFKITELVNKINALSKELVTCSQETLAAKPLTDAGALAEASNGYVAATQELLNVLIGKQGLLAAGPFLPPVRQTLIVLERSNEGYLFSLVDLVPEDVGTSIKQQQGNLAESLTKAINLYSPSF